MSWKDRIANTIFTITTGDGREYTPLWKNGETFIDFNVAVFDFINLEGSLIDRKKARAEKFPLVFWFQGDDNIDQATAFKESSKDSRAWTVQHPFYGTITGQPIGINFNDFNYGVTEVSVDFWETITDRLPQTAASIPDTTADLYNEVAVSSPEDYAAKVDLKPADVSAAKTVAVNIDALISKSLNQIYVADATISDPIYSAYNNYQVVKNAMFTGMSELITAPVPGMAALFTAISAPAQFDLSVQIRLQLFQTVYGSIGRILQRSNQNNKAFFESGGAAVIGAMAKAAVNPLAGDYITRNDIAAASDIVSATYHNYLDQLDNGYVKLSDNDNTFTAANATQTKLQTLVIQTVANLNSLAFNAKQERTVLLEKDSNLIVLTHKYVGLDKLDENLEAFRNLNNIKNRELFLVKKGRQIKYLV